MWHWIFEMSRVRKARKAAVTVISPIVENSRYRLGGIADAAWSDPYMIGFMVMLISIIARIESGRIDQNSMTLVQCKAWEDITSQTSEMMAEDLLLLNASRNRDFELGCSNAAAFGSTLLGGSMLLEGGGIPQQYHRRELLDAELAERFTHPEGALSAWAQFFDAHVLPHSSPHAPGEAPL
jgi:hypothetical protein